MDGLLVLTLLAFSLCGRHYCGHRCWDRDSCQGNQRTDAGSRRGLAARRGTWLVARRWSTWGGSDVGSWRLRQSGTDGEKRFVVSVLHLEKLSFRL